MNEEIGISDQGELGYEWNLMPGASSRAGERGEKRGLGREREERNGGHETVLLGFRKTVPCRAPWHQPLLKMLPKRRRFRTLVLEAKLWSYVTL